MSYLLAAIPPLFRLGNPALWSPHIRAFAVFCMSVHLLYFCVICALLCSFSTLILLVGSFDLKNRLPDNRYCVDGDVKHCSINQSINQFVSSKDVEKLESVSPKWPSRLFQVIGNDTGWHSIGDLWISKCGSIFVLLWDRHLHNPAVDVNNLGRLENSSVHQALQIVSPLEVFTLLRCTNQYLHTDLLVTFPPSVPELWPGARLSDQHCCPDRGSS